MPIDADANNYGNDASIEYAWAEKAFKHANIYLNLLQASPDVTKLNLTNVDEKLYKHFREAFQDLDISKIDEDHIKSKEQKPRWREYMETYKEVVSDYNAGTLLRIDASCGYSESNTCLVPRTQFLAIEIARNRERVNDPQQLRSIEVQSFDD